MVCAGRGLLLLLTAGKGSNLNKLFYGGVAMRYTLSLLLVVLFSLTACGLPSVQVVRYTMDTFEPTTKVKVLQTWPQDRKYIQIGELEVSAGDQANNALLDKAKEMGADAIVIEPAHQHGKVYVPINAGFSGGYRNITLESVRVIAIKFEP
jgi:hypothetical protein